MVRPLTYRQRRSRIHSRCSPWANVSHRDEPGIAYPPSMDFDRLHWVDCWVWTGGERVIPVLDWSYFGEGGD